MSRWGVVVGLGVVGALLILAVGAWLVAIAERWWS